METPCEETEHVSVCSCPPFMSVGIFLNLHDARNKTREKICQNILKAHCKKCLFSYDSMSFIQYTHLYSVLHMSQINVR